MKKMIMRASAFLLLAMLLFANVTITVDDTSYGIGGAIAAMAFGGDVLIGGGGFLCYGGAAHCNSDPYGGECEDYWRCNPNGPCLDADGVSPKNPGTC